jgi:hypothetical protein
MGNAFPSHLLRAALPIPAGTPRNAPAHRLPLARPSFSGLRALPLGSLRLRKTGFALPSLYWRFRLVIVSLRRTDTSLSRRCGFLPPGTVPQA